MDKTIDYLEALGNSLWRLSRLCAALSCARDGTFRPSGETISASYEALCDILEDKANEIDGVVSEYYKARADKP